KVWAGSYIILAIIFITVYFLLRLEFFSLLGTYRVTLQKCSLGVFVSTLILSAGKIAEAIILKKSRSPSGRYNLTRMVRLICVLLIIFVLISFLFANWYAAAVSLGLISLILGFALQTPISSFIGWLYIIIRNPYHIGDRIQLNE